MVVSVLCCALADFAGKRRSWCTSVHAVFPGLFGRAIIRRHHLFFSWTVCCSGFWLPPPLAGEGEKPDGPVLFSRFGRQEAIDAETVRESRETVNPHK